MAVSMVYHDLEPNISFDGAYRSYVAVVTMLIVSLS